MIKLGESKKDLVVLYWLKLGLLRDYLDFFFFHVDIFSKYHITKDPNLLLIKSTFFRIVIEQKLFPLFWNPPYGCNVNIFVIINEDEYIVQIYNNKDIKLFGKNFVNIFLKACWYICQSKRYYLVLKVSYIEFEILSSIYLPYGFLFDGIY